MFTRIHLSLALILPLSACNPQPDWSLHNQATLAAMNIVDAGSVCTVDHSVVAASSFFVLLGVGLFTGLSHCLGMCGPLVGTFALHRRAEGKEVSTPLVLFQTGRLTTYVLMGTIGGGIGSVLAVVIRNWQGFFSVGLGLLVVLLGLGLLGFLPVQHWLVSVMPLRVISGWLKRLMTADHPAAPFGLGLTNGLLPCGPVYAMALLAAISGDALKGATVMLIFGLGTLPAMLGLGFTSSLISVRLRSHLYRVAAILVVIVGLQLALRGLALGGQISHTAIGSVMLW